MEKYTWKKLGKIFDPTEIETPEWMYEFAQAPAILKFDNYIRVYFSCRPKPDAKGQYKSYSAYVDLDNNDLSKILNISEKPILELGKLGTFDEFGTYPVSVIQKDSEYYAFYAGWTRCESVPFNTAIGMAKSKTADKFEKVGDGPILSYTLDEPFILSGPKIRKFNNKFYLFYIAGRSWILDETKPEPIYKIRMATSDDCINWTKHNLDLIVSKDELEAQASPDVIFNNGKYHMFFCYRGGKNYRGKENGYRIGYACSVDLENWTREDEKVGIDVSEYGWDSEMISYPHLFEHNSKIYMFYLGNQVGKKGFGLAELQNKNL